MKIDEMLENLKNLEETEREKFETTILGIEEEWREIYRDAQIHKEELKAELFNPSS
jgi:hypothetical protein